MNESTATLYQRARRRSDGLALASAAAMLAAIATSPAAGWLARASEAFGDGLSASLQATVALVLFVVAVVIACEVAALPARLYRSGSGRGSRLVARGLDRSADVDRALGVAFRGAIVALPAAILAAAAIHAAGRMTGGWWWIISAAALAAGIVVMAHGAPALLARLTQTRPVGRTDLAARLSALARRAGAPVAGIDELRSRDAGATTAIVAGLGRSRRIFISADVLRDWSDDEIEVVVAHEIAHHANQDLARTIGLDTIILLVALGVADRVLGIVAPPLALAGPGDLAALPLIAAVAGLVWIVATPLRLAQSRRQERLADARALVMTGGAAAFESALRRLGERRLVEERPTTLIRWLYHRHPPVRERLAMARTFRLRRGSASERP
jgi:STE24 endopeptidase